LGIKIEKYTKMGKKPQYDFHGIIHYIYELEYIGLTKKVPLLYYEQFDATVNIGTILFSQYNIFKIKFDGRYILYDPFILLQKARQVYFVSYPNICENLGGWCMAITIKP